MTAVTTLDGRSGSRPLGYRPPGSRYRIVVSTPTAEPGLWQEYLAGAAQTYGAYGVTGVLELDRVREGLSTSLFLAAFSPAGDVVAGLRAQGPYGDVDEAHALAEIRDGTLAIHFQPVVDMRDRSATGAEALLRWHHPTLGPVPPDLFVGVAEATNLAGELGRWVLDGACRQLAAWRADHPRAITADFTMAVNVSPVQLLAIDFVDTVAEVLARYDLSGRDLVLEVTEHAVVGDVDAASATLRGLRRLGVCIAIDDFGTGYSSLAQLKALPVNILKIDRGFVRDLGKTVEDLSIVRSIVGLADSFGLDLIAEGVETEIAAETLLEMGCTPAQGFLYSRPLPAEDFVRWITQPAAPALPSPR